MKYFEKISCAKCDYQSIWGSKTLLHLIFKHHAKPTKKDVKFAWRHGAESTIILFPVALCVLAIYFITFPFYWLHEAIDDRW